MSKIIYNRKAVSILPCLFGEGDHSKLTTKLSSLNHHDTVPQSPSTHARSRSHSDGSQPSIVATLSALQCRTRHWPAQPTPWPQWPPTMLHSASASRLEIPSLSPPPRNHKSETSTTPEYESCARTRSRVCDIVFLSPVGDQKLLLTLEFAKQPLPTAPSAAPSPSPSSAASSTAR